MSLTVTHIKALPAPSVKRLLRQRGLTLTDVAKGMRPRCHPSLVSRVVRKKASSDRVWARLAEMLNTVKAAQG